MSYAQQQNPGRSFAGFAIVVLLHIALIYAVLSGLANRAMEVIKGPLEAKVIEQVKPPPPDAPPPPPPDLAPPPPPFIPPPEVTIQQPVTTTNAIQAVTSVVPPTPAPPAPPAPKAVVPDQEVSARPIEGPRLLYPPRMEASGREGYAVVECTVDTSGHPSDCKLGEVRGGDAFGEAAIAFVRNARYHPAIRNGQPITEKHQWKIDFKLHD
jgi:periplasmic protein TonB